MTYDEFDKEFMRRWMHHLLDDQTDERMGLFYFKFLQEIRPDIATSIRGTPCDPYFRTVVGRDVDDYVRYWWEEVESQ